MCMCVKDMVYQKRLSQAEVLANDNYNGYEYVVLSLGTHPCGYVILNKEDKLYGKHYDSIYEDGNGIDCHGGLTYSESYLNFLEFSEKYNALVKSSIQDKWVIGWDYAHYDDYMGYYDDYDIIKGKKWTTSEIVDECKYVIDQLNNKGVCG